MWIHGQEIDGSLFSDYDMADIHMHIIPGVDDGSWNMEMSEAMLRMSVMQGIRKIIAASHSWAYDCDPKETRLQFLQLKEIAALKYPEIELYLGCEILCKQSIMKMIEEKLNTGIYPAMNQTDYVLAEFPTSVEFSEVEYCTRSLLENGWKPVIAHAERYCRLFPDDQEEDFVERLKEQNCLIQINTESIVQEENEQIRKNAYRMLERKQVDFIGSDAHRIYERPPEVLGGLKYLYEHFEKEYVDRITFSNAVKYFVLD